MAELKVSLLGTDKLIEVVAQGLGALAKPWMIRRVARAQADRMKILASAELEVVQQLQLPAPSGSSAGAGTELVKADGQLKPGELLSDTAEFFERRIEQRLVAREARRQKNLETIALGAADEIRETGKVSEDKVDDDWISRFFSDAQEVSDPDLQRLWSQILAREVATPRTISLRTLEVLRNLSTVEARLFQESLRYACEVGDEILFVVTENTIPWKNRHILIDCGLFSVPFATSLRPDQSQTYTHGGIKITFSPCKIDIDISWQMDLIRLTEAGKSLARISWRPSDPNVEYLEDLLRKHAEYFSIEVTYLDRSVSLDEFLGPARAAVKPNL